MTTPAETLRQPPRASGARAATRRLGAGASWLRAVAAAIAALAIAAATLPRGFTVGVGAGTDNSWMAAIAMAAHDDLVFGRDVVFTYGPLGWLGTGRLAYPVQGAFALAFWVLLQVGVVVATIAALKRGLGWPWAVLGTLALMVLAGGLAQNDAPQVAAVALVTIAAVALLRRAERAPPAPREIAAVAALGGVLAALELLIKLNSGATVAAIGAIAALALDPRPPWRALVLFAGSFAAALVVLWVVPAGQPLGALDDYLRTSVEIVSGHAAALKTEETARAWEYVGALVVAGAAAGTAWAATAGWSRVRRAAALCVLAVLLVSAGKQGFIRHDGAHAIQFFLLAAYAVAAFGFAPRRISAPAFVLAVVALLGVVRPPPADLVRPQESWEEFRSAVTAVGRGDDAIAENRAALAGTVNLDARTVALLRGHTVHVTPTETSVAFAHPEFRWRPLPVFQAYVAYTPALDDLNAAMLRSARAPEFVLRGDDPGRWFDQPATQLELFCRYREVHRGGRWQVLRRGPSRCGAPRRLVAEESSTTLGPGVPIPPAADDEILVARLRGLEPDLRERLRSVVLKPYDRRAAIDGQQFEFADALFARGVIAAVPDAKDYAAPFGMGWDAETLSVSLTRQITRQERFDDRPYTIEFWAVPLRE